MENLTDLVKMMSINGQFNATVLGAEKASDHFGADVKSVHLDRNLFVVCCLTGLKKLFI